jgi:hypothetical protein
MSFTMKVSIGVVVFFVILLRVGPDLFFRGSDLPPGTVVHGENGSTYTVR